MRLLNKYIIGEYLRTLLIILAAFSVVFVVVDIFDQLPKLLRNGAQLKYAIPYFALRLPYLFVLTSAVGVLLAGLFLMNTLSRYNESIAIRAAGISIARMVLPLFWFGLFYSMFIMVFGEIILPKAENMRSELYNVKIKGKAKEDIRLRSNIHYPGADNRLYYIGFFDGYRNVLKTIDITRFDFETGDILERITAPKAEWRDECWYFSDCTIRKFKNGEMMKSTFHEEIAMDVLEVSPEGFIKKTKDPMSMNFFELRDYIKQLQVIGEKHQRELTQLHFKLSFPFANLIIILFCVPLASTSTRSKGRGLIFLVGLLICFLYLSMLRVAQSFGFNGVLSPAMAAWLPNLIFASLGIYFVVKAEI
ncbi:MAG: LptF/LptG family permease [Candidatus Cloacimonetes bacterium]|nr:LptF/LptG family permease [Candidatus Cloacimonadota bacterium]